jgi:hypothetical protein
MLETLDRSKRSSSERAVRTGLAEKALDVFDPNNEN